MTQADRRDLNLRIRRISDLWIEQIVITGTHRDLLKRIVVSPTSPHRGAGRFVPQFWLFCKGRHLELFRWNPELASSCQDCPVTLFPFRRRGIGCFGPIPEIVRRKIEQKCLLRQIQLGKSRRGKFAEILRDPMRQFSLSHWQRFALSPDHVAAGRPIGDAGNQPRLRRNEPDGVGRNGPQQKLVRKMEGGIGIFEKRQEMIGTILLEEKIVKGGIPHFPRVHQQPPNLLFREIEAVFPDIPILDISILLYLQVVGIRREVSAVPAKNSTDRIGESGVRRYVRRIVDRIRQNSGLFGLALLINPKKRMAEHGCGIIQEGRGEDERDRVGLEVIEPAVKPFAGQLRQTGIVEL